MTAAAITPGRPARRTGTSSPFFRVGMGVVAFVLLGGLWELYKAIGPQKGFLIGEVPVLPRANDASMPHLSQIWSTFGDYEVATAKDKRTVLAAIVSSSWFSLKISLLALAIGSVVGMGLALLMQRFRTAERALLPYIVLSQTVPLIALAPLVSRMGNDFSLFGHPWEKWMSVAVIASYLAFFPISIGALRGLQAATTAQAELMHCYAAGWWSTLIRLRLPTAVPYLIPALKLGAASAVIGTVVAEISIALKGGIGRTIIDYSQTTDSSRVYTAIIGAAALGLVITALVSLLDLALRRYRKAGEDS